MRVPSLGREDMDIGARRATVHGVAKSRACLSMHEYWLEAIQSITPLVQEKNNLCKMK